MSRLVPLALAALLAVAASLPAGDAPDFTRTKDVIYGRKHGMVLTMDVFAPKKDKNGAAIVWVVSGGWFSNHASINPKFPAEFLKRGYTVFAVVHGSQPKFTIPEILEDMHRSVRFIRTNAKKYGIDGERIGITGGSAGGHLSLMQGTAGTKGDPKSKDPVDQASSRVQAVACFFPPTDFLNYGKPGEEALGNGILAGFKAPFDFREFDKGTKAFVMIRDGQKRRDIGKLISPVYHATSDDPPTLIIHGDADKLVPIQQAELMVEALKKVNVPAELVVRKGAAHGWADIHKDLAIFGDWFDKHLTKSAK